MGDKARITPIPYIRKCFYDTYANLPVAGIRIGDLGYATDHRCLYRWSGAAWDVITIYSGFGLAANIPVLPSLPNGSLYHATDTNVLYMVQSGVWEPLPVGSLVAVPNTQVYNANAPTAWTDLDLSATVGARHAFVALKVAKTTAGNEHYAFRSNGDTDDPYDETAGFDFGCVKLFMDEDFHAVVIVFTDVAGIIEWKCSAADATQIDVLGIVA